MDIKDISNLNEKWTRDLGISFTYPDGTFDVHAGALGSPINWINENMRCRLFHFRFDFKEIMTYLELHDLNNFVNLFREVGEEELLNAYCYVSGENEITFLKDKGAMFDKVMEIVENMNNYEIREYHKFLIDNIAFE